MTNYRNVRYKIPTLNLDGTVESSPAEGEIWYDSGKFYLATDQSFSGVWSSGGNLSTARYGLGGCGTQSAGFSFAGADADDTTVITEEYNGTAWSSGGNIGVACYAVAGAGTQTAGLIIGGRDATPARNVTQEYDGTSCSSGGNLATGRWGLAASGIQTAAWCAGGWP